MTGFTRKLIRVTMSILKLKSISEELRKDIVSLLFSNSSSEAHWTDTTKELPFRSNEYLVTYKTAKGDFNVGKRHFYHDTNSWAKGKGTPIAWGQIPSMPSPYDPGKES